MGRTMQTEQKKFAEHRRFFDICNSAVHYPAICGTGLWKKPSRETWQDVDTEAETVIVLEEDEEPKIRMEDVCLELYREAGRSGRLGEKRDHCTYRKAVWRKRISCSRPEKIGSIWCGHQR